jgi:hypothetical protein
LRCFDPAVVNADGQNQQLATKLAGFSSVAGARAGATDPVVLQTVDRGGGRVML